MSKSKFFTGLILGAGFTYLVFNKEKIFNSKNSKCFASKLDRLDKNELKNNFKLQTEQLKNQLDNNNPVDTKQNFDDIKLNADQIIAKK